MTLLEVPAIAILLPSVARIVDWRAIMPLGLASLVTIPLGAWFLVWLDTESLQRVIGVLVLIFAFLLAIGWRYKRAPTLPVLLGVGAWVASLAVGEYERFIGSGFFARRVKLRARGAVRRYGLFQFCDLAAGGCLCRLRLLLDVSGCSA